MSFLYSLIIGFVTLIVSAFSYLFIKSAIFRYIVRNPLALVSLIKHAPKSEEEKMDAMMNDPYLSAMFSNKAIQEEMKQNMKKMMEQHQNKKLSIQKKWHQIQEEVDEDIISDESNDTTKEASTDVAVDATEESVEATNVAVDATEESVEATDVSVEATDVSVEATEESVEATDVSVKATEESVEATDVSVEETDVSVEATDVAVEESSEVTSTDVTKDSDSPKKSSQFKQTSSSHEIPKPDFNNPMFRSIIQNPEMMLSMMPDTPQKAQLAQALKNPMMRQMMTNPDLMKSMMETMPPPGNFNMNNSYMPKTE